MSDDNQADHGSTMPAAALASASASLAASPRLLRPKPLQTAEAATGAGFISITAPDQSPSASASTSASASAAPGASIVQRGVLFYVGLGPAGAGEEGQRSLPPPLPRPQPRRRSSGPSLAGEHARSHSALHSPVSADGQPLPLSPRSAHSRSLSTQLAGGAEHLSPPVNSARARTTGSLRRLSSRSPSPSLASTAASTDVGLSPAPVAPAAAAVSRVPSRSVSPAPSQFGLQFLHSPTPRRSHSPLSYTAPLSHSQPQSRRTSSVGGVHVGAWANASPPASAAAARQSPHAGGHVRSPSHAQPQQRGSWGGSSHGPSLSPSPRGPSPSPFAVPYRSGAPSPSPSSSGSASGRAHSNTQAHLTPVQVFCRFRPCFADELPTSGSDSSSSAADLISVSSDCCSVQVASLDPGTDSGLPSTSRAGPDFARTSVTEFAFQHVFQPGATQAQVFERIVQPLAASSASPSSGAAASAAGGGQKGNLVDQVLSGQNATILAYGQTGTGKTYSVEGPSAAMLSAPASAPLHSSASASAPDLPAGPEQGPEPQEAQGVHELRGLIPRLVEALFAKLALRHAASSSAAGQAHHQGQGQDWNHAQAQEVEVSVSYFELYRGKIRDLLAGGKSLYTDAGAEEGEGESAPAFPSRSVSPAPSRSSSPAPGSGPGAGQRALQLHVKDGQVVVAGLSARGVRDARGVMRLLREGQRHRTVASTRANATSSRGHAVFDVCVRQVVRVPASGTAQPPSAADGSEQPQTQTQPQPQTQTLLSRLRLVDLAGSEQHLESGEDPARLGEARDINRSLAYLAKVILALSQGMPHVPYRDSSLTRLLGGDLGPQANCQTLLLVTCSPARGALRKTMNTLRFGAHASAILNAVRVNARRRTDSASFSSFVLPGTGSGLAAASSGAGAVAGAGAGAVARSGAATVQSLEEQPCWDRLQELHARDGTLRRVPTEFLRGLLATAGAKTPAARKGAPGHGSSPPSASSSSSEVRIQLRALQDEFATARAHHAQEVSHLRAADHARSVAAGQNLAVQQRLRKMDRALRALLQGLARAGFVKSFLRQARAASAAAAAAAGDNSLAVDEDGEPLPAADPVAEAEFFAQLSQWDELLATPSFDACADGEVPPAKRSLSPLSMLRGLVEHFPPRMHLDDAHLDDEGGAGGGASAPRGRSGVASPLRKGRPAGASPARSHGSNSAGPDAHVALEGRVAQLQAQNQALQLELDRLRDPDAFPLQARADALQLELDAGYAEIVRASAENEMLRAEVDVLRLRGREPDPGLSSDGAAQSREERRERIYLSSTSELRRAHAEETSALLALLDESSAEVDAADGGGAAAGGGGRRVSSATVRAMVEARVAAETAELRRQLALAQADLARDDLVASPSASVSDGSGSARSRSGVKRQLFHSSPLQDGSGAGGDGGGDADRSLHTLAEGRESVPSSASPSPNRARGRTTPEEEERVSAAIARRTAALERDFAATQARWMQEKEREFACAVAGARGAPLSPRDFSRGITTPSPSAHSRPFDPTGVASSPDTAELTSALSAQLAAEKAAYATALRARVEAEQADWAGQLEERQRASVDARVAALEAHAAAAMEALSADTSRRLREHHDRLEARVRRAQTKADQAAELKKLQWQDEAVREFQQRQAKENQQHAVRQSDRASPSSSPRSVRGAGPEEKHEWEEEQAQQRLDRSAQQTAQVRLALLEVSQQQAEAELAARERRLREWRDRLEADEAARAEFDAQRQHNQHQQGSMEASAQDQVRQVRLEYEQLLSQERLAHAAEVESLRATSSSVDSAALAAQVAPSLAALQARFVADKIDWMERSKRAMDAEVSRRVQEEKERLRAEHEARVPAAVQEGLTQALERERGAWVSEAQRQFAAAVQQEAGRAAQAAAAQCSILGAEAAANAHRWAEREEVFSRALADQAARASAELSCARAAHEERERDLLSRAALASSLSASASAGDNGRAHRELERAFQQREEALQAQFEARIHAQVVAPLERENRSLAERARMLQALLQQREERDKIAATAPGATVAARTSPPSFSAHAHLAASDCFSSDKTAGVEQRPRHSEQKEQQEGRPTSSRSGASAAASKPDPGQSRPLSSPSSSTAHQVERAAIQAQLAQLDAQLHEAQFSPGRGSHRAGNNAYSNSSGQSGGLTSPTRSSKHDGASHSMPARTPAASPSHSASQVPPVALLSHLEEAGPSDYPFGSPSARSVQWVARLQAHQASETAAQHLELARGGVAPEQSMHYAHLQRSGHGMLSPAPVPAPALVSHPLLAAPFVDHLERELYASHQSYLAAELSALGKKSATHGDAAKSSSNAPPATPAAAAAAATAAKVSPSTPLRESDAPPAPRTDSKLSRVEVELQRAQANIQLLVDAARDAAPAPASAAASSASLAHSEERSGASPVRRTFDAPRGAAASDPFVAAASAPNAAATAARVATEAAANPSSIRLESAMASLQAELGATTQLLHSERHRHAEADQLEQTLLAHALVHSVATPPRSPAAAAAPASVSLRSPWAATVRLPAGFAASPASLSHSAFSSLPPSPFVGRSLLHGYNGSSPAVGQPATAAAAAAAAPSSVDPFNLSSLPLRLTSDPAVEDRAALAARTSDAHFATRSSALRQAEARTEEARRRVQRLISDRPGRGAAAGAASPSAGVSFLHAH